MSEIKIQGPKTVMLTVRIDSETNKMLEQLATEFRVSKSNIIRTALTNSNIQYNEVRYYDQEQARIINKNIVELGNVLVSLKDDFHHIGVNFNQLTRAVNAGQLYELLKREKILTKAELESLVARLEIAVERAADVLDGFLSF